MLSLIGSWGRVENWSCKMAVTSSMEDIMWNGPVSSKPSPCSQMVGDAYVFHDVMFKQPILNRPSLLCLNLIARNQEKL